jgi:predicted lipoprotein
VLVVDFDGDGNLVVSEQPALRTTEVRRMLGFQRLDVYRRAIEFLSLVRPNR